MRLGLTGSIATGKSTVAEMLKQRGCPIIDADVIAREVVMPGTGTLQKIKEHFGDEILQEDGTLNREKLGSIVFENPEERTHLNEIIHPAIRGEMKRQAEAAESQGAEIIVLDIPLLMESKLEYLVDKVLVVYLPEELQKKRLIERNGYSEKEAVQRISSQMSIEEKRQKADEIIDNSGSIEATEKQVKQLIEKWEASS
ncbi:dephospho-CoA kinase [Alkalicoccus daliensis]|uniref:Dephospho-CoA kinase n=1 Tax=Alkalicoccus daliensis TaxID=745820 RepID=A0A1H0CDT8_9BACI|nr:dephospho-CoA kinase [Alkalicoccus daliensis]SDN56049.1 dephospho-CoA kinase [Alkalicoccus daliensis]